MTRTLKYIFSGISLFLLTLTGTGQDLTNGDTIRYGGVRFGIDLIPFIGFFTDPPMKGYELYLDAEVSDGWYLVAEGGRLKYHKTEPDYAYRMKGSYLKLGVDHNILGRRADENESIFWGLRIAAVDMTHEAEEITIHDDYWGDLNTSLPPDHLRPFWFEVTVGIKAEVLKNFFMGWNVRGHFLLIYPKEIMQPYIIPGYGNAEKNFPVTFNYVLSYRFPYKLKVKQKKKKKKETEGTE